MLSYLSSLFIPTHPTRPTCSITAPLTLQQRNEWKRYANYLIEIKAKKNGVLTNDILYDLIYPIEIPCETLRNYLSENSEKFGYKSMQKIVDLLENNVDLKTYNVPDFDAVSNSLAELKQELADYRHKNTLTSIIQMSESLKTKAKYLWNYSNWSHPETAYDLLYHAETGLTNIENYLGSQPCWEEWRVAIGRVNDGQSNNPEDNQMNEGKMLEILKSIPDDVVKHHINMLFINWVVNLAEDGNNIPDHMCWTNEDRDEIFRFHKAVVNGTLPLLLVD